jgi:glycerol-3-phosphate acyltransferase PlsX
MKIGLDIMGGDFAPKAALHGAMLALPQLLESQRLVLFGDRDIVLDFLREEGVDEKRFDIVDAPEVIGMDESPTKALTNKPDSSISAGFRMLKHGDIQAFTSAGSSGGMLVGAIFSVNTIQGIIRPSIPAFIPKENGGISILIDVGANPDAKPDVIAQFGLLGSIYAEYVLQINDPKVGLLNIGTEDKKGNLTTLSAFQLMKDTRDYNFIGNVEGRDLFKDHVDVIVCDGFVGNIVLKQSEAMYRVMVKRGIRDSYLDRFNYEIYGGSPVLGVNGNVVVGHGISSGKAICNMILQARDMYLADLPGKIRHALERYSINE